MPARHWRLRNWLMPRMMAKSLRRLPPPRRAVVSVSPTWAVAAKLAWPETPVVFIFSCLLANCQPFTWPENRRRSFWQKVDFAGVRRYETLALTRSDLTLAPTHQSVDEIVAFAPDCGSRVEQCDYGAAPLAVTREMREQKRREFGVAPEDMLIAAVGLCDKNKAFDLAIKALPNIDFRGRLLILGDGPELNNLKLLAENLKVADRVVFAGAQRDLAPWYAAADCTLSTSGYDTFPNVLMESMSAGRPIVTPRHQPPQVYSGYAEVVRQENCGLCYDRRRPGDLEICINRLIRNPSEREALGRAAKDAVKRRFNWTNVANRVLTLIGEPDDKSAPSDAEGPIVCESDAGEYAPAGSITDGK